MKSITDKFILWLAPRVTFFSHIGDACCYLVCVSVSYPFDTTRSLSAKARPLLFRQQHSLSLSLSPRKVTCSICVLRCPCRPVPFAAASCVRSEDCAMAKGARADVDRGVLRAFDPPPRPRSARGKSSSRWKLIGPIY
jgi:hypothetical protein